MATTAVTGANVASMSAIAANTRTGQALRHTGANTGIRAALDVVTEKWARDYSPATREALKLATGDVMTQEGGFSIPQLTTAVDKIPEIHTNDSAKVMAQTLSYAATNFANLKAWKESGVVKTVVWYTIGDDKVCELCAPLDGKEVLTGADFFAASYGNGNQPPRHEFCRCGLRPERISIE